MHDPSRWQHKDSVPEQLAIKLKPGVTLDHEGVLALMGAHEATHGKLIRPSTHRLHVPLLKSEALAKRLIESGLVEYAAPDILAHEARIPNDIAIGGNTMIIPNGPADFIHAWDITIGSAGIPVADIGSGADIDHTELAGKLLTGYNVLDGTANIDDTVGHNTPAAGFIAGLTDNNAGIAGLGWNTTLIPIKATNSGSIFMTDIATGIDRVRTNYPACRVINISYSASAQDATCSAAILAAWNAGIIICAAAGEGNGSTTFGDTSTRYPAGDLNVVGVSQCNNFGKRTGFSNYGAWCSIAAGGADFGLKNDGTSATVTNGTSFASPVVAVALALMLNVKPSYSVSQLRADLLKAGDPTISGGVNQDWGGPPLTPAVMLNAYRACDIARGPRRASFAGGC